MSRTQLRNLFVAALTLVAVAMPAFGDGPGYGRGSPPRLGTAPGVMKPVGQQGVVSPFGGVVRPVGPRFGGYGYAYGGLGGAYGLGFGGGYIVPNYYAPFGYGGESYTGPVGFGVLADVPLETEGVGHAGAYSRPKSSAPATVFVPQWPAYATPATAVPAGDAKK